jgi:hypothetical protein
MYASPSRKNSPPSEQLHQGRLARTVLAHDREHLAMTLVQMHVVECPHAGEALARATDPQ